MTASIKHRYELLDGVRGLAAIVVMLYHYSSNAGLHILGAAWVAVDLFFALSGFVLSYGYEQKIRAGMSFKEFMKARLIRLYPLYFLGLNLGLAALLIENKSNVTDYPSVIKTYVLSIFAMPYFGSQGWIVAGKVSKDLLFPLNNPLWSLSLEVLINIVFFAWAKYAKAKSLRIILPASFLALIAASYIAGTINGGWASYNYATGLFRVAYQFFIGVALFHIVKRGAVLPPITSHLAYPLIALLLLFFWLGNFKYMLLSMFFITPLLILACAKKSQGPTLGRASKILGDISYPLYTLHMPILSLMYVAQTFDRSVLVQILPVAAVALLFSWLMIDMDARARKNLHKFLA
jgi:peptidoglycan/LPS O-acetylase OafA/YrhL